MQGRRMVLPFVALFSIMVLFISIYHPSLRENPSRMLLVLCCFGLAFSPPFCALSMRLSRSLALCALFSEREGKGSRWLQKGKTMAEYHNRRYVLKALQGISSEKREEALFAACLKVKGKNPRSPRLICALEAEGEEGFGPLVEALSRYEEAAGLTREQLIRLLQEMTPGEEAHALGVVYTAEPCRSFLLEELWKENEPEEDFLLCDPSCGCGGFLLTAAELLHGRLGWPYERIFTRHLFGAEVREKALLQARLLLDLFLEEEGEEPPDDYGLLLGDALGSRVWEQGKDRFREGFDWVVGNPPFVRSANIPPDMRENLSSFVSAREGQPDLYLAFFERGLTLLKPEGVLGYLSPAAYLTSRNGRELRALLAKEGYGGRVVDFRDSRVFPRKGSFGCLSIFRRQGEGAVLRYGRIGEVLREREEERGEGEKAEAEEREKEKKKGEKAEREEERETENISYTDYPLEALSSLSSWRLSPPSQEETLWRLENAGRKLAEWTMRGGLMTLCNRVFIFQPLGEEGRYYVRSLGEKTFRVEKALCRDILRPSLWRWSPVLEDCLEKVLFPYGRNEKGRMAPLPEEVLRERYPEGYAFFLAAKETLLARDKGRGSYPVFYAYGRNQGIGLRGKKLVLPHLVKKPLAVPCLREDLLFYHGLAILEQDEQMLRTLQCFLESGAFAHYLRVMGKPYQNGYRSVDKSHIGGFSIPPLTGQEREELLALEREEREGWIWERYGFSNAPALEGFAAPLLDTAGGQAVL